MTWTPLTDINQLDIIEKESATQPVLIFKHSTTCSISNVTKNRLERSWDDSKAAHIKAYYLDLLSYRPISRQIAEDYSVEHESPQALLIKNGNCIYDASHYDIAFDEIIATH